MLLARLKSDLADLPNSSFFTDSTEVSPALFLRTSIRFGSIFKESAIILFSRAWEISFSILSLANRLRLFSVITLKFGVVLMLVLGGYKIAEYPFDLKLLVSTSVLLPQFFHCGYF
jgi:hypothetical protein